MAPKVVILMADYGSDPTETTTPFTKFKEAGFQITFATETGNVPRCDSKLVEGITQKLLGADKQVLDQHAKMLESPEHQKPVSWTSPEFTLETYDLVFLPGGHDKAMQQIIGNKTLHKLLASYVPTTKRPSTKALGAICHGVQVLAEADLPDGRSVIHDFETTSLTKMMEGIAYWGTRPFLGDYYKTYGHCSDAVETVVRRRLDDPDKQYKTQVNPKAFVHEDPNYNYFSGRWPGDAALISDKLVEMVKKINE